jgi:L-fuconolactonase
MSRCIDTHIHIWDLEKIDYAWLKGDTSILNRTYALDELTPQIYGARVTHGILVQAANNIDDTDWMLETASRNNWIPGVVGWLPLLQPQQTEKIFVNKYAKNNYFKGVRHLIHDEPDEQWLLQDEVLESLQFLAGRGIPYDIVGISTGHLKTALKLAEKIPQLRMVFDHLNQPPIRSKEQFGTWGELMKEAAAHDRFYCKISGLGTASGNFTRWTADDIKPYILHALELFGTNRCFCGGDWPVSLLAGSYEKSWMAYRKILEEELSAADQQKVLFDNAAAFYSLNWD